MSSVTIDRQNKIREKLANMAKEKKEFEEEKSNVIPMKAQQEAVAVGIIGRLDAIEHKFYMDLQSDLLRAQTAVDSYSVFLQRKFSLDLQRFTYNITADGSIEAVPRQ